MTYVSYTSFIPCNAICWGFFIHRVPIVSKRRGGKWFLAKKSMLHLFASLAAYTRDEWSPAASSLRHVAIFRVGSTWPRHFSMPLILDHSYLVGNLTNSKIAETKTLEPLKSWHWLLYQQFSNLFISQRNMSGSRLGALSNNRWSGVPTDILMSHVLCSRVAVLFPSGLYVYT